MTKQLEHEFKALISTALTECRKALDNHDYVTAEYFRKEAFELICKLPENQSYMKLLQ